MRKIVLLLVFIFAIIFGLGTWKAIDFLFIPPEPGAEEVVVFDVLPDSSFQTVSDNLLVKGLVKNPLFFKILA